jgi:hypothetical protein
MADANIHASLGVADGVNVNYDVYRIKTKVSEQGAFGAEQPRALLPSGNTTILQVFNAAYL